MKGDLRIPKENRMNEQIDRLIYELYGLTEEEIGSIGCLLSNKFYQTLCLTFEGYYS